MTKQFERDAIAAYLAGKSNRFAANVTRKITQTSIAGLSELAATQNLKRDFMESLDDFEERKNSVRRYAREVAERRYA